MHVGLADLVSYDDALKGRGSAFQRQLLRCRSCITVRPQVTVKLYGTRLQLAALIAVERNIEESAFKMWHLATAQKWVVEVFFWGSRLRGQDTQFNSVNFEN